ncbi:MAG: hypothetical protein RQ746_05515 [Bacteroidales bacterium]|nr:hypothetical protein [Bacteroidales bacterium]
MNQHLVKTTYRHLAVLALWMAFLAPSINAQVIINTIVSPPYGPFVEDYAYNTRFVINAADLINLECYLQIRITGNTGIELQSLVDMAYPTFTFGPVMPITLTGNDILEYFMPENLALTGISYDQLRERGLPAGSYQVCAVVYYNGRPLSAEAPAGCSNSFTIPPLAVTAITQVIPPYPTDINEYASQARVTLQANRPGRVTLRMTLEGDNGIRLTTHPGYNPGEDISLPSAVPQIISPGDLYVYFQPDAWMVEGISGEELFNAGLPEGNYRLCTEVFENDVQVSPPGTGCSGNFNIRWLDPPLLIGPQDQGQLKSAPMQHIIFSWTPSPGAPPWTNYQLKIVEVWDPEQDPADAMLSAPAFYETDVFGNSFFYGPAQPMLEPGLRYAFQVTASDPESGRRFSNFGRSEVFSFIYGNEEENILTPMSLETQSDMSPLPKLLEDFKNEFEMIPATRISGKLFCKFPDNPNGPFEPINIPSAEPINMPSAEPIKIPQGTSNTGETGTVSFSDVVKVSESVGANATFIKSGAEGFIGKIQAAEKTPGNLQFRTTPYYYFGNTEEIVHTKPLANVRVKLVGRYAYLPEGATAGTQFPVYGDPGNNEVIHFYTDLNGKERLDKYKVGNVVLAVAETDDNGNFSFDFRADFFTGTFGTEEIDSKPIDETVAVENPAEQIGWQMQNVFPGVENSLINAALNPAIESAGQTAGQAAGQQQQQVMSGPAIQVIERGGYICLKIEVENEKFCSPDIDIMAMPGDVIKIPDQVAKLKTYNLEIRAIASNKMNQAAERNKTMDNVSVHIMRGQSAVKEEMKMLLDYEGQKLKTKTVNEKGEFNDVFTGKTGAGENAFVYIQNLVKHAYTDPQYMVEISTRDMGAVDIDYENTRYNYRTIFDSLPTSDENSALFHGIPFFNKTPHAVYNHLFTEPPVLRLDYTMHPLDPEIKGRVMAETNIQNAGVKGVKVQLINQVNYNKTYNSMGAFELAYSSMKYYNNTSELRFEREEITNEPGFFRFNNLHMDVDAESSVSGPYRRIFVSQPGYKNVVIPGPSMKPWNLSYGILADVKDINLEPVGLLTGFVQDEDGNPVVAYVKTEYSPFYKTYYRAFLGKQYQFFDVPVQHYYNKIYVQPKSSQYFEADTTLGVLPQQPLQVVVYKKLHRPEIIVKNKQGEPVSGAVVTIDKFEETTTSQGVVRIKFAAAGNQFILKITPPQGYAAVQQPLNIPVSKGWTSYEFILDNAKSIKGVVTDKTTGSPIAGAKVHSELKNTNGISLYIEAVSGQDGAYQLTGIPGELKTLTVHIVKTGENPTYIGKTQTIDFTAVISHSKGAAYNFALERANGWKISELWGFPVAVEKFVPSKSNPDEATIDGYFYNLPGSGGFKARQEDIKLPFTGLKVKRMADRKAEPSGTKITLGTNVIPFTINDAFSGNLTNQRVSGGQLNFPVRSSLEITKENETAGIRGMAKLDLGSFNIAHHFTGSLYIGSAQMGNKVMAFSPPKTVFNLIPAYRVFSLNTALQPVPLKNYNVYGFDASAELSENSILKGGKISLATVLHTKIPGCKNCPDLDLKIRVGDVVITNTDVYLSEASKDTISFELEKWKVFNRDTWYFDKNEEAIVLKKALVVTGQGIDATLKDLRIGPSYIGEAEIDLSEGGLSLGGVAKITLNGNLVPKFNYDATGHYRISVVGSVSQDVPAGFVSSLPAMEPGSRIEFNSIGMLSNNNTILSAGKTFRFFDIMDIDVTGIVTGNGYFDLVGQPDPGIPDFIPQITAMRYSLENGKITAKLQPLKGRVEIPGNVFFYLDDVDMSQSLTPGKYTAYGNLKISETGNEGDPAFYLRGLLEKTNDKCDIQIIKVDGNDLYKGPDNQKMIVGNNEIDVFEGETKTIASNSAWNKLTYSGYTRNIDGLNDPEAGTVNTLRFTVNGALDVTSQDIKVKNLDSGFGQMSMVYNFSESSMTGHLNINNLPLGFAMIHEGVMNVRFDANGYYFAMASQSMDIGVMGEFKGGLIAGNTSKIIPEHISAFTNGFKVNLPPFASQGITGVYTIGEKVFVDKTLDLKFVNVSAQAGMGLYVNADFSDNPEFKVGGYGHVKLMGSQGFEELGVTVCEVGLCLGAYFSIEGGYSNGNFFIENCASISGMGYANGVCAAPLSALGVDDCSYSISATYGYKAPDGFFYEFDLLGGSCTNNASQEGCE